MRTHCICGNLNTVHKWKLIMKFVDLDAQFREFDEEMRAAIDNVLD